MTIIVTGGAGFIGSNFIYFQLKNHPEDRIVCLDSLTYAGNMATLDEAMKHAELPLRQGRYCRPGRRWRSSLRRSIPIFVVNFAAESHVDRSVEDPGLFLRTNILGTQTLMDACRKYGIKRYHQVSTDEVYGDLPLDRPGSVLHRGNAHSHLQPLQRVEGFRRPAGAGLCPHLPPAGEHHPLLQ